MKNLLLLVVFLLSGCVSTAEFHQGSLNCFHTVSTKFMGTAQVVTCEKDKSTVYVNSFKGTAGVEPVEEVVKAGAAAGITYGVLNHIGTSVNTDNTIHIAPPGQ